MTSIKTLLLAIVIVGWTSMSFADNTVVAEGKLIKMDYTLIVNKEEVESSVGKEPLEFVYGDHSIIVGLEDAVKGMRVGEEKQVVVEPKDGYGEVDPKAFKEFPKSTMPNNIEPKVGMVLQAQAPNGENFPAVISEIKGDQVNLDFNHPLAGKQLTFKVKILAISDAPGIADVPQKVSIKTPDSEISVDGKNVSITTPDSSIVVDDSGSKITTTK